MALFLRLGNRQVLNQILRNERSGMLSLVRPVTLKSQPAVIAEKVSHDDRNMRLGRPQSPHLTIYKWELPMMMSLTHRTTGMMLAGYTILFGFGAIVLPDTIPHYIEALAAAKVGSAVLLTGKFLLAFPLAYHFWNGIRHLSWDMGKFFAIKEIYATGYTTLLLSSLTTVALCAL